MNSSLVRSALAAALIMFAQSCGAPKTEPPVTSQVHHNAMQTTFGGDRPTVITVPADYNNNKPTPLIVLLHGYGASGYEQTIYFGFDSLVNEAGIILAAPDGTVDSGGNRFWNATDACCNFDGSTVDDVGYISGLIADISAEWNVDPKRVYIVGHSNGAFMSYRMACDRAPLIAGIAVLAGDTWLDPTKCQPSQHVSVLDLQGDADMTIAFGGGSTAPGMTYPGVVQSVTDWAGYDHCTGTLVPSGLELLLDSDAIDGGEASQQANSICPAGIDIAMWTLHGSGHIPIVTPLFRSSIWAWLKAHPQL